MKTEEQEELVELPEWLVRLFLAYHAGDKKKLLERKNKNPFPLENRSQIVYNRNKEIL